MPFMPNSRPGVKIDQIEDEEDLEKLKKDLTRQQNEFKITLKSLEVMS